MNRNSGTRDPTIGVGEKEKRDRRVHTPTSRRRCAYERYKSRRSDCGNIREDGIDDNHVPDDTVHANRLIRGLCITVRVLVAKAQSLGSALTKVIGEPGPSQRHPNAVNSSRDKPRLYRHGVRL